MNWTEIVTDPPSEPLWAARPRLRANPLSDTRNTRQLDAVWIAGRPLEVVR